MSFEAFRALHHRERVLFLPNVWDAASAALFAQAGAEAIATTSAAVAWARGYADGGALPREELVSALRSVCRAAGELPVSADIEHGYSDDPARVASLVVELTEIGVAGINLEDGGGPPDLLAAKIVAVKRAVRAKNRDVFVNARADVYLRGLAEGDAAIRETIARAMIYERAGADGFYPIAVTDTKAISEIAHATKLALNVLADRSLPAPSQLRGLGVARVSAGPYAAELAYGHARRAASAFVSGDFGAVFSADNTTFDEMNALMLRRTDAH